MDPDVAWSELRAALSANDLEAARDHAAALLAWLDGGGFPPAVEDADLEQDEVRFAVSRYCQTVLSGAAAGG